MIDYIVTLLFIFDKYHCQKTYDFFQKDDDNGHQKGARGNIMTDVITSSLRGSSIGYAMTALLSEGLR
ncbi:hypothetical protein [Streptococcus fryi]